MQRLIPHLGGGMGFPPSRSRALRSGFLPARRPPWAAPRVQAHPRQGRDQDLGCVGAAVCVRPWGCSGQVEGDGGEGDARLLPLPTSARAACSTGNSGCISPNDSARDSNQLPPPLPIICAFFLPAVIFLPSVRSDYMIKGVTKGREQRGKSLKEERERLWALGALPAPWELPRARRIFLGAGPRGDPSHLL